MNIKNNLHKKPHIIVIGASGHAKVVIDIIEKQNLYIIFGLLDSYKNIGQKIFDYEILGTEQIIPDLINSKKIIGGIIAIGDNWLRRQMESKISAIYGNFNYVCAIHPYAIVGKQVVIKQGAVIVGGAVVNSDAVIERHCIINTRASVGHDCQIKEFSSIASGATLGGGVTLQNDTAVSLGAVVLGNLTIGEHTVIGAGALVTKNIEAYTIAFGSPARHIRKRTIGEPYF